MRKVNQRQGSSRAIFPPIRLPDCQLSPRHHPVLSFDPDQKDCLIIATEAYARLNNTAYWLKMSAFTWSEKGRVIGGHAVVFYQPTENSNVFMYDAGGSYNLFTQSHDLDEIVTALNQSLQKTAIRVTAPRWLDSEGSRKEFAVSKSDRQPAWWSPSTGSTTTEQTAAYQAGYLLGRLGALAIALGFYVWAIVICFLKGKGGFAVLGILGLLLPVIGWAAIAGAIRIAKPDSWWARKHYDARKMDIAHHRFTPGYKESVRNEQAAAAMTPTAGGN